MISSTPRSTGGAGTAESSMNDRSIAGPRLIWPRALWMDGLGDLARRSGGARESGAFLLGRRDGDVAVVEELAYYDDLESGCLDSGMVVLTGAAFTALWQRCRTSGRAVVADVHTHPRRARQSDLDRRNPMIAMAGHIAIIVPNYAQGTPDPSALGIYVYRGSHTWFDLSGAWAANVLCLD
jgi:proteasome lid subunit RPN8/RPN11